MARVIPIDIIKGISGKYGKNADFYFATNTSSGKIRISHLPKPNHRPPTEKQKAQRLRFAARHAAVTAWLNANKPCELNGPKGTEAYQLVQRLKRKLGLSLINQVLLKYMDEDNVIRLPETKEQRSRNPHKTKKQWKQITLENTRASHGEKTGNNIQFVLFKPKTFKTHKYCEAERRAMRAWDMLRQAILPHCVSVKCFALSHFVSMNQRFRRSQSLISVKLKSFSICLQISQPIDSCPAEHRRCGT